MINEEADYDERDIKFIMHKIDKDNDKRISYLEFKQAILLFDKLKKIYTINSIHRMVDIIPNDNIIDKVQNYDTSEPNNTIN